MKLRIAFIMLCLAATTGVQAQHIEFKWHGLYGMVDYSYMTNYNTNNYKATFNEFNFVAGWQVRKETAFGFGFSYLHDPSGAFTQMPLFVEYRCHFLDSRISPFAAVQAGYSIPTGSSSGGPDAISITQGGMSLSITTGARYAIMKNLGINIHVGYQALMMNEVEQMRDNILVKKEGQVLHNIKIGVGINF